MAVDELDQIFICVCVFFILNLEKSKLITFFAIDLSDLPEELNFDLIELGTSGNVKLIKKDDKSNKNIQPGSTVCNFLSFSSMICKNAHIML